MRDDYHQQQRFVIYTLLSERSSVLLIVATLTHERL